MGGGKLVKKSHWEVGGSRILDQDVGGLDFTSQLRDVGGFVFERFSPKQRQQIDTSSNTKCKQGQIGLKLPHSNLNWPGVP